MQYKKADELKCRIKILQEAMELILSHIRTFQADDSEKADYHGLVVGAFETRTSKYESGFKSL